ncbi:hypothetical protein EXT48_14310 [Pseudoalteromonas sp. CO348]|uniref:hypothetical protein n=1 Tax=Pseudoalteromonas TaxID=53246 RepID=UPI001022AF8F|nr:MULTISPECIES: hypothetical protein [Pseudoalteromonas]MCG7538935.1 hypothetical protein [Pseudoalteromonas sp. OF7H-1]QZO13447.1 hypothetical protein K5642_02660 [Pseudoalteromonas piscicida]RZG03173.1 hypothetical protein EXT48_14310 [Pseudoalteromonas sp. CO348]
MMLSNKNINDATALVVHKRYFLNSQKELVDTQCPAVKVKLSEACVLDRNLFWATTKQYSKSSLNQIFNIIKAQSKALPPFEGVFFWRARNLSKSHFSIEYFVIPRDVYQLIPDSCEFILPLYCEVEDSNNWPLSLAHENSSQLSLSESQLLWFDLIGLRIKRSKPKRRERLSNRNLAYGLLAASGIAAITLTSYVFWNKMTLDSAKELNQAQVNESIDKRRQYNNQVDSVKELQQFLADNPNVLNKLAGLQLNVRDVLFERVTVIPKGVELRGVTVGSATDLLKQIVSSPGVKEAKFSGPVIKQKAGGEAFTIEVVWL